MKNYSTDINKIIMARGLTAFGSGFSKFIIPLYVLHNSSTSTKHVGLQWAVFALTQLFACIISPKIKLLKNDKKTLIFLDIVLAIVSIIPLLLFNLSPIISAYLVTFFTTLFLTFQSGYFESLIGHISEENGLSKSNIFTKCKSAENLGLLSGFALAGICTTTLGYHSAFVIDAITFLLSGALIFLIRVKGLKREKQVPKVTLSLMFTKRLRYLSFAQMLIAFSAFIVNGTYVVIFKNIFHASDLTMNITWIVQFCLAFIATFILAKKSKDNEISDLFPHFCRLSLAPTIAAFIFISTKLEFIILYGIFTLAGALSFPLVQAMFQRFSQNEELRNVAIARITITAISGGLGAVFGSLLLENHSYKDIYAIASVISLVGSYYFWKHIQLSRDNSTYINLLKT